jgi:hypothetical protein
VAELNQRAELVARSGLPQDELKAGYRHHHDRLSKALQPASYAG